MRWDMPRHGHTIGPRGERPGRTVPPTGRHARPPWSRASARGATRFSVPSSYLPPPTPRLHTAYRPRARLGEIGHDAFDALRPIVTPFLGQDDRDIAQSRERGAAGKDPGGAAAP